jgi:hypothetical protein
MKRPTPSQLVSHFNIGWIAGIVEGEGSLAFYFSKRKKPLKSGLPCRPSPFYGVVIVNTDLSIINEVKRIWEILGYTVKYRLKSSSKKQREGSYKFTKPCYEITIRRRNDIEQFLPLIEPYLVGYKKARANEILNYFSTHPFGLKPRQEV